MPIGNTFPVYLRSIMKALILILLCMKRLKCFGQLSKDAFGINYSEKMEFLKLIQSFGTFVHDIISNLHGAINRGNKQTDIIIVDFANAFEQFQHRRL